MAAPAFDYLDSMAWIIVASGIIAAIAAFRLRYNASTDSFEEENKNLAKGLGTALGLTGFYLLLTGIGIIFLWQLPFELGSSGGAYIILFGGAACLSSLVIIAAATAIYRGHGLQAASYFGFVVGLYLVTDAVGIQMNSLTKSPLEATLLYLAPAAVLLLSPFATHIKSKYARWAFGILAFAFAAGWLYFAYNTTLQHLGYLLA